MAALDFPDNPNVGDLFGSASTTWRWNGTLWESTSGAAGARGVVAFAQRTTPQTGIGASLVDIAGLSVSWVANPARTYKTTVYLIPASTVTNDDITVYIKDAAGATKQIGASPYLDPTTSNTMTVTSVESGLSGATTRKVAAMRGGGTGTITLAGDPQYPMFILVEDITFEAGSSGQPVGNPTLALYASLSAGQDIVSGVATAINWNVRTWNTAGNMWNAATPSRLIAPVAGMYLATATLRWGAGGGATGEVSHWIAANGGTPRYASFQMPQNPSATETGTVSTPLWLTPAGAYIEVIAYHNTTGNIHIDGDNVVPAISNASLVYLGPAPA